MGKSPSTASSGVPVDFPWAWGRCLWSCPVIQFSWPDIESKYGELFARLNLASRSPNFYLMPITTIIQECRNVLFVILLFLKLNSNFFSYPAISEVKPALDDGTPRGRVGRELKFLTTHFTLK